MNSAPYTYRNLFPKQREALKLLGNRKHRTVVYGGGAGGGKSWLGIEWVSGMALNFPNTRWFIGRKELKRIKQTTLVTFYKVARLKNFTHLFEFKSQDSIIRFTNGSEVVLLDLDYQPRDPLYERFGSAEFTGGFIEEGGEIHFDAYDTLKSRVGRMLNNEYNIPPKIFVTCNPKKNWLYSMVYRPWRDGNLPQDIAFVKSLVTDNPLIGDDYIQQLRSLTNRAKKERLLFGNWEYDDNPYALYDYEKLIDCFTSPDRHEGTSCITVDVARKGKDFSVIFVWEGWTVVKTVKIDKSDLSELKDSIQELQKHYKIANSAVIVDEDGVGGGLVDFGGYCGFLNGSRAVKENARAEQPNYANLKTQCACRMADNIEKVRFADNSYQQQIIEDLEVVEETNPQKDDRKITISTRQDMIDKLGRSPDFFSSFLMRYFTELKRAPKLTTITTKI